MRPLVTTFLAMLLLVLTNCAGPEIADCEQAVQGDLTSPASYKRVSTDSFLDRTGPAPVQVVRIEYDADNSFGATLRDTAICKYLVRDNRPDVANRLSAETALKAGL